jgi:hypothetical protein
LRKNGDGIGEPVIRQKFTIGGFLSYAARNSDNKV